MAILINSVFCSKCEREIGPGYHVSGGVMCTPCMLDKGTVWTSPRHAIRPEIEPIPKRFEKPKKMPKRRAKSLKCSGPSARTDRQRQSGFCAIYAIQMRAGVVKVGRTTNWAVRKHSYTNGFDDVIKRETVFRIIDDHEILADIETALLQSIPNARAKGYEWILADYDEIAEHTDQFLRSNGIMFEKECGQMK